MERILPVVAGILFMVLTAHGQSDQELNRDSVIGWQYVSNPPNARAAYKPIKSQYVNGAAYSVWQQQASDMLINWIQQSYLPRGLVMRTIAKNDDRWYVDGNGPLHSYGVNFLGYAATFVRGKIDLHCCEQGQRLQAGFNDFPGSFVKGFNPGGMYFFAEQAQFTSGDDEAQLTKEGIDKKIQPNLYGYRTYLDHYHDNGQQVFKIGVVVPANGDWPFKPVLVKDAVAYIQQQMAACPGIMQKNPYSAEPVKKALERLKPYYNEVVKLNANYNYNNAIHDDNGHYLLNPEAIINGRSIDKTFPEYNILVTATQQTMDQTKTDNPLWIFINLTPTSVTLQGNPAKFDIKFGTGVSHMAYSLLNNFNFDFVAKWLALPDERKTMVYSPVKTPAISTGNISAAPATVSATASEKNKDPYTILYEDFEGYPAGVLSAKKWHTAGYGSANSSLVAVSGQRGKWVVIPEKFTFYPDLDIPLTENYTVNYDVYFGAGISNKRVLHSFRLDAYDPKDKYPQPMNMASAVDKGTDFAIAMSGEATTECKFRNAKIKEIYQDLKVPAFKEKDIAHISVSVNGTVLSVSVNGKEVIRNDNALPAGKSYKRVGWYCSIPNMLLGNVYIKSNSPVQHNTPREPSFAGVVKESASTPDAASFGTADYSFKPLSKIDNIPPTAYPAKAEGGSNGAISVPVIKTPARSALLDALPNAAMGNTAFQKFIDDLKNIVAGKLGVGNTGRIDSYLTSKKIAGSKSIAAEAMGVWIKGKPTAALYMYCKALQADYSDMNTANNLASLLNAYGYPERAIPILQFVNSKLNGMPEVSANMATAYYNLGDMDSALLFADKAIRKDSLSVAGNKVAAFVYLSRASKSNSKSEADKAIGCLKQALQSRYDKDASELLARIEANHQKQGDYFNTNFKEFPMLRRLELPAMPEDLAQAKSFNAFLEKEKSSLMQTAENIRTAMKKYPEPNAGQMMAAVNNNPGLGLMMGKATVILQRSGTFYMKMKSDLEQVFIQDKNGLTGAYSKKIAAIARKYNERLNKLEGGEGKGDEEEEIERLKMARCEEYNKEGQAYLSDIAKLTNRFAQKSELISRNYFRDYANWTPVQLNDNSNRSFLYAQAGYLIDVRKILSLYTVVEPCIYPSEQTKEIKAPARPKQWEEEYCANFKGTMGIGAAKIGFNCNSMSISGGEGIVGDFSLSYDENGSFKEITIGVGPGMEAHWGNKSIAGLSAGVSAVEYITIGAGPNGGLSVTDWGVSAGVSAGANVGTVGGEVNIASVTLSAESGVKSGGVEPDGLKMLK